MDLLAAIHSRPHVERPSVTAVTTGILLVEPDVDYLAVVSVHGSEPIHGVPAVAGAYAGVTTVRVLAVDGRPVQVLGPFGSTSVGVGAGSIPPPPPESSGATQSVTRVITPTQSGTWRVVRGSWGRWGAAADVYQASTAESGQLWGLACYGDTITSAGFASISRAVLTLAQLGTGYSDPWVATVRGSASGSLPSSAPTYTGDTVSVTMPGRSAAGQTRTVELAAGMREGLRTGSIRSLGLTGGAYGGTLGLGNHGAAWALSLTGEVPV